MEKLSAWNHTSYLSQAPQAVPVEKNSAMWRNLAWAWRKIEQKILPVEKKGQIWSMRETCPTPKVEGLSSFQALLHRSLTWFQTVSNRLEKRFFTIEPEVVLVAAEVGHFCNWQAKFKFKQKHSKIQNGPLNLHKTVKHPDLSITAQEKIRRTLRSGIHFTVKVWRN